MLDGLVLASRRRELLQDPAGRPLAQCGARLEACQAYVYAAPARTHEVNEQGEVIDTCVALGEKIALDALQAPDGLVEQPPHLGDVPGNRQDLGPKRVTQRQPDLRRDRRLQDRRRGRERFDLLS